MATAYHVYHQQKDPFRFLPQSIRNDVRVGVTVFTGLVSMSMLAMLFQHG